MDIPDEVLGKLGIPKKTPEEEARSIIANNQQGDFVRDVMRLLQLGDAGLEALIDALTYRSLDEKMFSAKALGAYQHCPKAKEALFNALNDEWNDVRWLALIAISPMLNENDVPRLVEKITDPSCPQLNLKVYVQALFSINCDSSNQALLEYADNNLFGREHRQMCKELSIRRYVPALIRILKELGTSLNLPDGEQATQEFQGMIKNFPLEIVAREAEQILFKSNDVIYRLASIEALRLCGLDVALQPLTRLLSEIGDYEELTAGDRKLVKSALLALGGFKSSKALTAIVDAIKIKDKVARETAFEMIELIGDPSATPYLVSLVHEGPGWPSSRALDALAVINPEAAFANALALLLSRSFLRSMTIDTIARLGRHDEAITWLTLQMKMNPPRRFEILEIISELRKKAARNCASSSSISIEGIDLKHFSTARLHSSISSKPNIHKRLTDAKKAIA